MAMEAAPGGPTHDPHRRGPDGPDPAASRSPAIRPLRCFSKPSGGASGAALHARPPVAARRHGEAMAEPIEVRDVEGDHFTLGDAERVDLSTVDVVLLRQDPPFDLAYITTTHFSSASIRGARGQRSARCATRRKSSSSPISRDLMPPTLIARDKAEIEAFRRRARRSGDEAALRPRRRRGVQGRARGPQFRLALRPVRGPFPRAVGDPALPAEDQRRRQAHHPRRWRGGGRGQSRAGGERHPLQHGARRRGEAYGPDARASARSARRIGPAPQAPWAQSSWAST